MKIPQKGITRQNRAFGNVSHYTISILAGVISIHLLKEKQSTFVNGSTQSTQDNSQRTIAEKVVKSLRHNKLR